MPVANSKSGNELFLPISPPLACMFWVLAALFLWMSLGSYFDSITVYKYATGPEPSDLKTATFQILQASSRTPNFKIRFDDGTTEWLSFPDRLGGNPKGGLQMPQISDYARTHLRGCMATAKIRSVLGAFGRRDQAWELDCPQAHIHYGPEVTSSEIRKHPLYELVFNVVFATFFLFVAFYMALAARALGKK
jgi:hypothetical protein